MELEHSMDLEIQGVGWNSLVIKSRNEYLLLDVGSRVASIKDKLELDKLIEFLTYHRNNNL